MWESGIAIRLVGAGGSDKVAAGVGCAGRTVRPSAAATAAAPRAGRGSVRVREHGAPAAGAEVGALGVRVGEGAGEVQCAAGVGAVPEAGDVAELVDGLGEQAVLEARVAGRLAVELGAEAGDADDRAAAVDGGLAEHEVEARDEEVAIEHGEGPDARGPVAVDERIEDDVGAVLRAVVVVPVRVWFD